QPETFNLVKAFRGGIDADMMTPPVQKALAGQSGVEVATNYLGDEVVSAFAPVELLGLKWAITSEIATEEAFRTVDHIAEITETVQFGNLKWTLLVVVIAVGVIAFVARLLTRQLMAPIDATVSTLRDIAEGEGDLTRRLDENQIGELGDLAVNFNRFATRIHDIVRSIANNSSSLTSASNQVSQSATSLSEGAMQSKTQSSTVSSAAEELSINMENMSKSTSEMSDGIVSVSSAVEEMKQTIAEIAQNAERSAAVAGDASDAARVSNEKVGSMGDAANEIGRVIEVIQDIAEQTNLLALNATIEAARAGESGKGFAVVATEVKELAKQTAAATDDIRSRIEAMQRSTGDAVDSIATISSVIDRVNELYSMIASAVEEQNITTGQIAGHVTSTAELAQTVARGVSESASASREITQSIGLVDSVLQETAEGADQSRINGDQLSGLAIEMRELVKQFRVDDQQPATLSASTVAK
ncbi:MAG: methyl-accepting chemotaxis protein, partial [Planctomycetota bacterium]